MRRLSECTLEEIQAEAEELREEMEAADLEAAGLLSRMLSEWDAEEAFPGQITED